MGAARAVRRAATSDARKDERRQERAGARVLRVVQFSQAHAASATTAWWRAWSRFWGLLGATVVRGGAMMGVKVMFDQMFGVDMGQEVWRAALGKKIEAIKLVDDDRKPSELQIHFADGTGIAVFDDGQSCCEYRHTSTDDDLTYFVGATLMGAEITDGGPRTELSDERVHDEQFLKIATDRGVFTLVNHDEHSGYYGGFSIKVKSLA
jgi:hypothetical protein